MRARRHVFVCIQTRPEGGRPACGTRGSADFLAALREEVARRPALWDIAVTGCECLGPCFDGPNAVVYPEGIWYAGLTPADATAVADRHLAAGEPVSHLVQPIPIEDDGDSGPEPSQGTGSKT